MDLTVEDLPNGVARAALRGRMDIEGAQSVDMKFNVLAGAKKRLVVDMTEVDFIASMGLRTLMTCARSINSKGGKMAIAGSQPNVEKVLMTSGMDEVASMNASVDAAVAQLAG